MAYQTKMVLRLAAPAVMVFAVGMVMAFSVDTVTSLPVLTNRPPAVPDIGDLVALGSGFTALLIYGFQMFRYWRWTLGEGDVCFVCACLLGRERDGRYGPYRKCLGCGKNHAVGRI